MMKLLIVALLSSAISAYIVPRPLTARLSTRLQESFGLGIGEDSYENQPVFLRGEAEYKQWLNNIADDPMLNRQVRREITEKAKIEVYTHLLPCSTTLFDVSGN